MSSGDKQDLYVPQMRDFILLSEDYARNVTEVQLMYMPPQPQVLAEEVMVPPGRHPIMSDLDDICERLRAFMESAGGDYALGVETGMERAAGMIENLIRRYEGNDVGY